MHVMRYVMSRIFVFWLSVAILVYGWFFHTQLVNGGYGASEALVRSLTRVDQTGKTETVVLHILHLDDLVVIGAIMLVVTLLLTAARNLALGSGERRLPLIDGFQVVLDGAGREHQRVLCDRDNGVASVICVYSNVPHY